MNNKDMAENNDSILLEKDRDDYKQFAEEEPILVEYDITTYPSDFTLSGLWQMFKQNDITIPSFQRGFVWTPKQASSLIESFLIGLPVPPIFFYIDSLNKNLVIDGQQRLMSIFFYFEGYFGNENEKGKRQVFRLSGLNKKSPYYNMRYIDLAESDRRKLDSAVLRAINVRQLSPTNEDSCMYHIFERLNTGGTPLTSQEIRNCVYRGPFFDILMSLNIDRNWRRLLGKQSPDKHLTDVELMLRAFGLRYKFSKYEKPMKEFLNNVANHYKNLTDGDVAQFQVDFPKTCAIIADNLPEKPFSVRGPLNTSVFDSVFCTILKHCNKLPLDITERYNRLLQDENFINHTTLATTDTKILKERFDIVEQYLVR